MPRLRPLLFALGAVALSAACGVRARAADLPPWPPAAPAWTWDGIYLGGHAGYAWAHDPLQQPLFSGQGTPSLGNINLQSALAGFQAGANWQNGAWLAGLEFDISATGAHGASSAAGSGTMPGGLTGTESLSQGERIDMLGSGRVRFGYLPRPDLLLYGTGGLGWTRVDLSSDQTTTVPVLGTTSASTMLPSWRAGWVAGAGAEMRLAGTDWLARLEYLHYDFGGAADSTTTTIINGGAATTGVGHSGPMTVDLIRAGLSYKFGGGGPAAGWTGSGPYAGAPSVATVPSSSIWASPWNWTGFYMGAHTGYGWTRDRIDQFFGSSVMHGIDGQGGLAGFQAGANWQRGALVGGLEIDASATDIRGQNGAAGTSVTPFLTTSESGTDGETFRLLGSARARLGYLVSPTTLLYGTGGLAWTEIEQSAASVETMTTLVSPATTATSIANATTPSWRFGWVTGLGAEQRIGATNWIGRLEYLHYDFGETGSLVGTITTGGVTTVTPLLMSGHLTADIVRAGASYRFGGDTSAAPSRTSEAPGGWNGFYVGVHGGGGLGNDPFNIGAGLPPLPNVDSSGWLAGGHAGANWQAGRWLAGLETDVTTTGIKGSSAAILTTVPPAFVSESVSDSFKLLGSARARLGWLPWPNLVVYGSGGLAWTQLLQAATDETSASGIDSITAETVESWRWGWAAGLGVEARIGQSNWLGRIEYLHYDFGKSSESSTTSSLSATAGSEGVLTTDIFRLGLSYQLN